MYHYVRDFGNTRYPEIKGLDVKEFETQLRFLRKNFNIIRMENLFENLYTPENLPTNAALLTFDDGYKDHIDYVLPLLKKYNLQGSFYPPARVVLERKVLDVNKIHLLLASIQDKIQLVNSIFLLIDNYAGEHKLRTSQEYWQDLARSDSWDTAETVFIKRVLQRDLPEEVRAVFVDKLFKKHVNESEEELCTELYLNKAEIKEMVREGMHFGGHGHNHYWLGHLNDKEQAMEISSTLSFLKECGVDTSSNWSFCYPYGDYNNSTLEILKSLNCTIGLTTAPGAACFNQYSALEISRYDTNDFPPKTKESQFFRKVNIPQP